MKIVFFAARQLHKEYFSKLALQLSTQFPQYSNDILWHKSLWKDISWLACVTASTKAGLAKIVDDHMREKQNSRKGRLRHKSYWPIFRAVKSIEARILFAIYYAALKRSSAQKVIIWNGLKFRQRIVIAAAKAQEIDCLYMENGLLPGMTTLDKKGINYHNSVPRSPNFYSQLNHDYYKKNIIEQLAEPLAKQFKSKPNSLPSEYIFVPFQVNTDSQIILFSPWIVDMMDLVDKFDQASKDLDIEMPNIVFKPHPACDQNYDHVIQQYSLHPKLHFSIDIPTPVLIQHAKAVVTINSTVGIEALLLNKKLITLGQAFYQIDDLALAANDVASLINCLKKIDDWAMNQGIRSSFFNYLATNYQVAGRWQDATAEHLIACSTKLASLIKEEGK